MQTVANLQFLQFAQVVVDGRKRIIIVSVGPGIAVEAVAARQIENVPPQAVEAARVHPGGEVVFVHQRLKLLERAIGLGAGQGRGEVVDHHRADPAFGLRAFAGVVDDEGVELRQRPGADLREALARERDGLAGQPFQIAVLADMNHRLRAEVLRQPDVEGEIGVRRRQGRIVIAGLGIDVVAARGLHGDGEIAETVDRQAECAVPHEGVGGWRAPALGHGLARAFRHLCEGGFIGRKRKRSFARAFQRCQIVGHAAGHHAHQRGAVLWRFACIIARLGQGSDDRGRAGGVSRPTPLPMRPSRLG